FLGNVGHRGLLVADLPEQTLRDHENPLSCVRLDMFRNQRHVTSNVQLFGCFSKRKCEPSRMLRRKIDGILTLLVQALAEPQRIETWQVKQGQESCNKQSTHDGDCHRSPERRAR